MTPHWILVANGHPLPFTPYKGQLGFFEVDESILKPAAA